MPVTDIEWTDRAWPVVNGCRRVSPGCENCWAERSTATRLRHHPRYKGLAVYTENGPRWTGERRLAHDILDEPLRTKKPQRWFVANKGDLFSDEVTDEQIAAVFGVMAATPQHTYQLLTKRPERLARWFDWLQTRPYHPVVDCMDYAHASLGGAGFYKPINDKTPNGSPWPLRNVWLGVSVEDQQRADERIPHVLRAPAAVRFLSVEPMIGPVNLRPWFNRGLPSCEIDWVIVGGESGPGARPCNVEWVRSIVAQCKAAEVPVFVKQLGGVVISDSDDDRRFAGDMTLPHPFRLHLSDRKGGDQSEWPEGLRVREFPDVTP